MPPEWNDKFLVPELQPPLPQQHGTEDTVQCSPGFNIRGTERATCQDGVLVPSGQPPTCLIGMFLSTDFRITWVKYHEPENPFHFIQTTHSLTLP